MRWLSCQKTAVKPITDAIVYLVLLNLTLFFLITLSVWSNFEIASLALWRGEAYSKYFDYLDQAGGFYYEVCHTHK